MKFECCYLKFDLIYLQGVTTQNFKHLVANVK